MRTHGKCGKTQDPSSLDVMCMFGSKLHDDIPLANKKKRKRGQTQRNKLKHQLVVGYAKSVNIEIFECKSNINKEKICLAILNSIFNIKGTKQEGVQKIQNKILGVCAYSNI